MEQYAHFPFEKDLLLENDRALLKPLCSDDFSVLLPYSLNEPELWTNSLISGAGEQNLRAYIAQALEQKSAKREYPFLIVDKRNGKCAGVTRFYAINEKDLCLSIGYTWIGKDFQGTGLNKAIKKRMMAFTFEELNYFRIEFRSDVQNARSIAAVESLGAKREGVLRSNAIKPNGERRDTIVLSILKEEWHLAR